jgi:hypothetical protein
VRTLLGSSHTFAGLAMEIRRSHDMHLHAMHLQLHVQLRPQSQWTGCPNMPYVAITAVHKEPREV